MVRDAVVGYLWHPWRGRGVRVHEVTARGAGTVARCSLDEDISERVQELPSWMLDAATCRAVRSVARPEASMPALAALGVLLAEALARSGAAAENPFGEAEVWLARSSWHESIVPKQPD